ncbi:MAG: PAS domain-containing sensor histidine kinase [Longimicrobiales bacterium]
MTDPDRGTALGAQQPRGASHGVDAVPSEVYEEVFRAAPDGILIVSGDGTIRFANPQCLELFGYTRGELVGAAIELLIPERYRRRHEMHRHGYVKSPTRRPMNAGLELYGLRKDGTQVPVEISLSPTRLEDGNVVIAMIRDVTDAMRMRAYGAGTVIAAENERRRIARELHDDTAQRLAAVQLGLKRAADAPENERHRQCDELRKEVASIAGDVSRIARGLMPPELEQIGVVESIRTWLRHRVSEEGPRVSLRAELVDGLLDVDQRLVLYRIVQEAVSNVVRHAKASRLWVTIAESGGVVEAVVQDDGVGFEGNGSRHGLRGLGLMGMRERAAMVGALVSIDSRPNQGTRIRVVMKQTGQHEREE